ncbi:MAG: DUF998 domain-containing protein [Candidatus Bathyarchaeia archaeon]
MLGATQRRTSTTKLAGLCGFLPPIIGFTSVLGALSMSPWFDWRRNALSDLGVGSSSLIFNLGLILGGLPLLIFGLSLYIYYRRAALGFGWLLLALSGASLTGIGAFPEDKGAIHLYFSVAFFTLLASSLLSIGLGMFLRRRYKLAAFTLLIGASAALVWLMPHEGTAIPEATSSTLGSIWIITITTLHLKRII